MNLFIRLSVILFLLTLGLYAEREKIKSSVLIFGGVSLDTYESGYNWALIKMINRVR
jgi:hypothetical protein